ncbi:MAG: TolC family protein [Candidatus Krumholzibacteria bacterium]|nr:TolC family protein [Candidatus Krumholzibacteria bacterium]
MRKGLVLALALSLSASAQVLDVPAVQARAEVLDLDTAMEEALRANLSYRAARAGHDAVLWEDRQSWLAFLPTGNFTSSITRVDEESYLRANQAIDGMIEFLEIMGIDPGEIEPFLYRDTYRNSFTLSQQFPLNLNLVARKHLSGAGKEASLASLAFSRSDLLYRVRMAYLQVLASREMSRVAEANVRSAENRRDLAQEKLDMGLLARSDLLRWESTLAEARSGLLGARKGEVLAGMELNRLLGRDLGASLPLAEVGEADLSTALALSELDAELLTQRVLGQSPAGRAIQAGNRAAKAAKSMAFSGLTPSLHFQFSYGWQDNDTPELDGDNTWNATALLSFPVFDLSSNYASYRKAGAEQRRSEMESLEARENLRLATRATLLEVARARESLTHREKARDQAIDTFEEMESRYELGHISEFDLIDVQVARSAAEATAIAARHEYYGALFALEQLLGEPTPEETR